jgi:hypothetical protein
MRIRNASLLLAVLLLFPSAAAAQNGDRFTLFGDAQSLTGGLPPNGSVHLTSHCNPYDPDANPAPCSFNVTFSGINYRPRENMTFAQIQRLSAHFNVNAGDCGGGSPRFEIALDTNNDGEFDGNVFVYFGPAPNFTDCRLGWQSTGNVIGNTDAGRWDTTSFPGGSFGTYAEALALLSGKRVLAVQVVVDGGWVRPRGEAVDVDNFRVNNDVLRRGLD